MKTENGMLAVLRDTVRPPGFQDLVIEILNVLEGESGHYT